MKREHFFDKIELHFRVHSVCAILGPRQVGKTTLARTFVEERKKYGEVRFFDLEKAPDLAQLDNPFLTLSAEKNKLIVIDEIQRRPELFPTIRVLVDDPSYKSKFLILGSASRDLLRQSSETLAGRIGYIELSPLSLHETKNINQLWMRGGFPSSYFAQSDSDSFLWRENYLTTFLERDIPNLGFNIPPLQLRRFWLMLSNYHGQVFTPHEITKSLEISRHSARNYLDALTGTFMVRELCPWFENIKKRQIKSPKIYFRDSGVLHALLNIQNMTQLQIYPRLGSFWEGFAQEEIIKFYELRSEECFFWATQAEAELDLFIIKGGKRLGFEFKYSDTPKVTKSMNIALQDLNLDHLYIVYPYHATYPVTDKITALGLESLYMNNALKL